MAIQSFKYYLLAQGPSLCIIYIYIIINVIDSTNVVGLVRE